MMRLEVFTDPLYHRERHVEFEPSDVVSVHERDARLFGRGKFRVTEITLRTGLKYLLRGEVADQIRAAQEPGAPEGSES